MSRTVHVKGKPSTSLWVKAWLQWISVLSVYSIGYLLTYPMGILVAATSKKWKGPHPQGKLKVEIHSSKYVDMGSSGKWEYWNPPSKVLRWWANYEDGTLGEPSGKHSARRKGTERTFISQYLWTIRNPFNWAKRTISFFHCLANECTYEYYGDYEVSDEVAKDGWYFVIATDQRTGKKYYGYRKTKVLSSTKIKGVVLGFKIKPSHGDYIQDDDDLDKSFTFRFPVKRL